MNDITKLPKWAQQEITRAREEVTQMHCDVSAVVGGTPSAIEVDPHRTYRHADLPRMFLPEHYAIRFALPGGGLIECQIVDGAVRVWGHGDASGDFIVRPISSNVIEARFEQKD